MNFYFRIFFRMISRIINDCIHKPKDDFFEVDDNEMPFIERFYGFAIVAVIILIGGFFINKLTYVYNQDHIICNDSKCEIQHINLKEKKVVKTDKFKINEIKNFVVLRNSYHDYFLGAEYKDGTTKAVSRCNVDRKYKDIVYSAVDYLNETISKEPLEIDLLFPSMAYFPEYQ